MFGGESPPRLCGLAQSAPRELDVEAAPLGTGASPEYVLILGDLCGFGGA